MNELSMGISRITGGTITESIAVILLLLQSTNPPKQTPVVSVVRREHRRGVAIGKSMDPNLTGRCVCVQEIAPIRGPSQRPAHRPAAKGILNHATVRIRKGCATVRPAVCDLT
jgi:hypothetical protein